jgi:hypothetical protein
MFVLEHVVPLLRQGRAFENTLGTLLMRNELNSFCAYLPCWFSMYDEPSKRIF